METEHNGQASVELEVMAKEYQAVAITDGVKMTLIRDLAPVADRMREYTRFAAIVNVANREDAERASGVVAGIDRDLKLVTKHDVLSGIIKGLDQLHKRSTAFRALFTIPLERDRKTIRQPVLDWEAAEKAKAAALAAKLQADADAKAQREREALLKKAATLKTPEKAEALREQAAQTFAPTVHVEAPKSGLRTSKAWKIKKIDLEVFFKALAERHDLSGYVEVQIPRMERAKAANPSAEIPGVTFELMTR